ncbi:MAG: malectin domain-containing carbohydrate-binding protein [Oceanipulchritudo sp.]
MNRVSTIPSPVHSRSFEPMPLNAGWASIMGTEADAPAAGESGWKEVKLPHNWEDYHAYNGESHGNLHGTAWYRRRLELAPPSAFARHALLLFEGVGSYADVWLDNRHIGRHAGGRTAFWTPLPEHGPGAHELLVRARHPADILDLPHVCGGCWGAPNTEGNQPFGIHRPVQLEWSGPVRVLPFGVYAFADRWQGNRARIRLWVELMNFSDAGQSFMVEYELRDADGAVVVQGSLRGDIAGGCRFHRVEESLVPVDGMAQWSPERPYLHQVHARVRMASGDLSHAAMTVFGLRKISWPSIVRPNDDRNVRCMPEGIEMEFHGWEPVSEANKGFTTVLSSPEPAIRTAPCGVRIFQQTGADRSVSFTIELSLLNDTDSEQPVLIEGEILNGGGTVFLEQFQLGESLPARSGRTLRHTTQRMHFLQFWTEKEPYLHKLVISIKTPEEKLCELTSTTFGIIETDREINAGPPRWREPDVTPPRKADARDLPAAAKVFRINDKPVFLRGGAEYETLLGADHAFTEEQIRARAGQILACGFNAFRDAHHPHNLRYYPHWDKAGLLCWTQFGSHIWFDSDAFRQNFRSGLVEWVRERRAHPCIIAWGIQNESLLPEDFASECCELIRQWDPTARSERLCLTCNGGKGSDWNVPQEWSGTYGGNCNDYDLESLQMVGEYGAWRSFGLHRDTRYNGDENDHSESWACHAMGTKIRIGEEQRDRAAGHWHWIFNTFPNPGRSTHSVEDHRNGQFGPVNNKGLVTAWEEPCDLFFLFRSAYADPRRSPMVYIVSPTWPDRFQRPGTFDNLQVFSNCDEVELFNGHHTRSFGTRRNPGPGRPFVWNGCLIDEDLLHAEARMNGKVVAIHYIRQRALPTSPGWRRLVDFDPNAPAPGSGHVLHAINCGGSQPWTDPHGVVWKPESLAAEDGVRFASWARDFPALKPDTGSIGFIHTPVHGAPDPDCPLFSTYRYGRHRIAWEFPVNAPEARVECFFLEPFWGAGGGIDATGWRLFDVAVNGVTVLQDFDPWTAAGGRHHAVVRRTFTVRPVDGRIHLAFPRVAAGQAVIAAIRVAAPSGRSTV